MKRLLILLLLASVSLSAQRTVYLKINHKLSNDSFAFMKVDSNDLNQKFVISRVDYYISNIAIIHDGGKEKKTQAIILAKGSSKIYENLGTYSDITNIEGIRFSIGVDTPFNHADPALSLVFPLQYQTASMHWGWASGYKFVALEGKSGSGLSKIFELHPLGDSNFFSQLIPVIGSKADDKFIINIDANYTNALRGVDVSSGGFYHGLNTKDLSTLLNFRDNVFKASVLSSSKDVLGFSVPSMVGTALIDASSIKAKVPEGSDLTNIIPNITVSSNASISPNGGIAQDFTNPVDYMVTAQDNSTKTYRVTISTEGSASLSTVYSDLVSIYPNPCQGIAKIKLDANPALITKLKVFNLYGQLIMDLKPKNEIEIDLSNSPKSIYYIQTTDIKGNRSVQKLMLD